jgi:hypothetical protein
MISNIFTTGKISGSRGGEYEDDVSFEMLRRAVWQKFTDVSKVFAASINRSLTSFLCANM